MDFSADTVIVHREYTQDVAIDHAGHPEIADEDIFA